MKAAVRIKELVAQALGCFSDRRIRPRRVRDALPLVWGVKQLTQVCSVDGQKYHGKRRPNVAHETGSVASRTVHRHGGAKENREHQPVGAE